MSDTSNALQMLNHQNVLDCTPMYEQKIQTIHFIIIILIIVVIIIIESHNAAHHGHAEMIQVLLQAGADPTIRDIFDYAPLDSAMNGRHIDAIQVLNQWFENRKN